MSVGAAGALVLREQEHLQEQETIPPQLARLMKVAETSVGVFEQLALLSARLEATERQNREMAALNEAQTRANTEEMTTLREQVIVLNKSVQSQLAEASKVREEMAALKRNYNKLKDNYTKLKDHLTNIFYHADRTFSGNSFHGSDWNTIHNHQTQCMSLCIGIKPLLNSCENKGENEDN